MPGLYVDTSALGRVLLTEPDATTIRSTLSRYDRWWSSALLVVELRRLAARAGRETAGEALLAEMELHPLDRSTLERASRLPPSEVRSLDAIHLEAAVALHNAGEIAAVLTFDGQLQRGCEHHELGVEAPTARTTP
jgi:predicted nucleic acid-binding protein